MSSKHHHMDLAAEFWWTATSPTKVVTSEGVRRSLGYVAGLLSSKKMWMSIVHSGDRVEVEKSLRRACNGELVSTRVRFKHSNGHHIKMLVRMQGFTDEHGTVTIEGVNLSINDMLALEAEASTRQEDLAQVASTLSHDFRAPARHMSGCADRLRECVVELRHMIGMLEMTSEQEEGFDEMVRRMTNWSNLAVQSGDRMGKMIEHVLQFSRAGSSKLEPESFSVAEVVDEYLTTYNTSRSPEEKALITVAKDLPVVYYDRTLLYMVLSNLISNALKFSKVKGRETKPVEVYGWKSDDPSTVNVSVRDYGVGIAKDHQKDIFDMGFRTHHERDYAGFGYGLAIVRRILVRCGGGIALRSKTGDDSGTEFILSLPVGTLP